MPNNKIEATGISRYGFSMLVAPAPHLGHYANYNQQSISFNRSQFCGLVGESGNLKLS
jgi:hypothetical protein